jgi:hypothetical protein
MQDPRKNCKSRMKKRQKDLLPGKVKGVVADWIFVFGGSSPRRIVPR